MVDRVYRSDLPALRKAFSELRSEFSRLEDRSDWVRLRIDPLLQHVERLERLVPQWESSPMRGGVPMLHSDLVYLRENLRRLQTRLDAVQERRRRPGRTH